MNIKTLTMSRLQSAVNGPTEYMIGLFCQLDQTMPTKKILSTTPFACLSHTNYCQEYISFRIPLTCAMVILENGILHSIDRIFTASIPLRTNKVFSVVCAFNISPKSPNFFLISGLWRGKGSPCRGFTSPRNHLQFRNLFP